MSSSANISFKGWTLLGQVLRLLLLQNRDEPSWKPHGVWIDFDEPSGLRRDSHQPVYKDQQQQKTIVVPSSSRRLESLPSKTRGTALDQRHETAKPYHVSSQPWPGKVSGGPICSPAAVIQQFNNQLAEGCRMGQMLPCQCVNDQHAPVFASFSRIACRLGLDVGFPICVGHKVSERFRARERMKKHDWFSATPTLLTPGVYLCLSFGTRAKTKDLLTQNNHQARDSVFSAVPHWPPFSATSQRSCCYLTGAAMKLLNRSGMWYQHVRDGYQNSYPKT